MTNYEAVPIDVELQKVTAGESAALSRHNRHENINTFLGNQNTPLLIGGAALLALTPILFDILRNIIADAGTVFTDVKWDEIKKGALLGGGTQLLFGDGGRLDLGLEELFKRYANDKKNNNSNGRKYGI